MAELASLRAVLMLSAALTAGACAGAPSGDLGDKPFPGWFQERQADAKNAGYPELAAVPQSPKPGKSLADWAAVAQDLDAAGLSTTADPRNAPAAIGDLAAFEAEARAAVVPPPLPPGAGAARATPPAVPPPAVPR